MMTLSVEKIYNCTGLKNPCEDYDAFIQQKITEVEVYWDLGRVTGFTVVFAVIYFVVWIAKMLIKYFCIKRAIKEFLEKSKPIANLLRDSLEAENQKTNSDSVSITEMKK